MEKINELLNKISKIVVEEKTQQEERRKRGENFNIFNVLGLSSSEVRLHSAFLAELLNPNGDHGLGNKFLKAFIEIVIGKKTNLDFDTRSAKTYVEYDIGAISEDYKEGGRIETLFIKVSEFSGKISPDLELDSKEAPILVGIIVAIVVIFFMYWFFGTEFGSAIRATGDNENMIKALGVNTKVTKLIALAFSNGLVGLSGALVAQSQKYGDINMGTGAIVIGLAAIVIGEVLLGWLKSFKGKLFAVIVGSIVYFVITCLNRRERCKVIADETNQVIEYKI